MKVKLICFLLILLSSNMLLARSTAGVIVGSVLVGSGAVTSVVSGIIAGVAGHQDYCDASTQFSQKAIVGYHDCSYTTCANYYCTHDSVTCYDYSTTSCVYNSGYCTCTYWLPVIQTCPDYGCKDPNSASFGPLLYRKDEPTYTRSLYAVYAGAATVGAGLLVLLPSLLAGNCAARTAVSEVITTHSPE
ncbi:MAG: hypothetical protein WCK42_02005 [Myxococcaceae bacterium]